MVYVTGDTHGSIDVQKLNTKHFSEQKKLTKEDYVIICGDFGNIWYPFEHKKHKEDAYWIKWFNNKPFTTLFIDGNHEGFPTLNSFPIVNFNGGKAGKIADSVFHLKRGEIYTLNNKTFFCFGGASSHDKECREEGISWWSEEMPTKSEMEYGIENLRKYKNTVDYIITHCCSNDIQAYLVEGYAFDDLTEYFQKINNFVEYKHWFFGHYHTDVKIGPKHTCVYDKVIRVV